MTKSDAWRPRYAKPNGLASRTSRTYGLTRIGLAGAQHKAGPVVVPPYAIEELFETSVSSSAEA
jgi:hypothetical protein